jgi:ribosome-associated protein
MIAVTRDILIPEREITMHFVRSSGPGGQNVNKVSTAVQLRFDVKNSPSLPERARARLLLLAGNRLTGGGVLVIDARRFRTRERNRRDALDRLVSLIRKAAERKKRRRATRPSTSSIRSRLDAKRRRSKVKLMRKKPGSGVDG